MWLVVFIYMALIFHNSFYVLRNKKNFQCEHAVFLEMPSGFCEQFSSI